MNESHPTNGESFEEKNDAWKITFVQKKMQESGFKLENEVWSIFAKELEGCYIEQNSYFTDWKTHKARELDLKITYSINNGIWLDYVFLVECKQLPENFWVLVKSRKHLRMIIKNSFSIWDNAIKGLGRQQGLVDILSPVFKIEQLDCDSYGQSYKEFVAGQKKQGSVNSNRRDGNLRAAEIKLAKAFYFEKREAIQSAESARQMERIVDHIQVFYPMLVFQGNLLESDLGTNPPNTKFINSGHLEHFSIQNNEDVRLIIDIVKIEYLAEFIQNQILPEIAQLKENLFKYKKPYEAQIDMVRQAFHRSTNPFEK